MYTLVGLKCSSANNWIIKGLIEAMKASEKESESTFSEYIRNETL